MAAPLAPLLFLGGLFWLLWSRNASARVPESLPPTEPTPSTPSTPPSGVAEPPASPTGNELPADFPAFARDLPATLSTVLCARTGEPYDIGIFSSPIRVKQALRWLGYRPPEEEVAAGFITLPFPREGSTTVTDEQKPWQERIISFQRRAMRERLPGYDGADKKWVDGIVGGCTLIALKEAILRRGDPRNI